MGFSKSNTNCTDDDHFCDAADEFPFDFDDRFFDAADELSHHDCLAADEPDQYFSVSSPVSQLETPSNLKHDCNTSLEFTSPIGLRRLRSLGQDIRKGNFTNDSTTDSHSSVSSDEAIPADRSYDFSLHLNQNERETEKSDSYRVRFSKKGDSRGEKEDSAEHSTVTTANKDAVHASDKLDLGSSGAGESSSNLLFALAGLVVNAIGFQISFLVTFFSFPIWLLYISYMFVIDPFHVFRRGKDYLTQKLLRIWGVLCEVFMSYVNGWLKQNKFVWKLALQFGWGFLWASYVCFVLVSLVVSAFIFSGIITNNLVKEPIQMKETLTFDYTQSSPVAFMPVTTCDVVSCLNCGEKNELENLGGPRVIPAGHKLKVTVSLTLPESDYNRNLGIFQVRVDFLSASGKALSSARRPCMLLFKSRPIHLLSTFLKVASLVTGYSTESQTRNVKLNGFTEGDVPTACLRVTIEQRAEFRPGAGIPEIYDASLILESELPPLRRILWHWKRTVFVWIGMTVFNMELLLALLFCRPLVMPRVRCKDGSADSRPPQNNIAVQRELGA